MKKTIVISLIAIMILSNITAASSQQQDIESKNFINKELNKKIPENLEIGDLLFCDMKPIFGKLFNIMGVPSGFLTSDDHVAMFIGYDVLNRPLFIHSMPFLGVTTNSYSAFRLIAKNIAFAKVFATPPTKEEAVDWAKERIGDRYQFDYINEIKNPNPTESSWYCSELIWAAYYNQGIDLQYNFVTEDIVTCWQLLWDEDIETIGNLPPHGFFYKIEKQSFQQVVDFSLVYEDSDNPWETVKGRVDFDGDGTYDTKWTNTPYFKNYTYFYRSPGRYKIKIQVQDNEGATAEFTKNIKVGY